MKGKAYQKPMVLEEYLPGVDLYVIGEFAHGKKTKFLVQYFDKDIARYDVQLLTEEEFYSSLRPSQIRKFEEQRNLNRAQT